MPRIQVPCAIPGCPKPAFRYPSELRHATKGVIYGAVYCGVEHRREGTRAAISKAHMGLPSARKGVKAPRPVPMVTLICIVGNHPFERPARVHRTNLKRGIKEGPFCGDDHRRIGHRTATIVRCDGCGEPTKKYPSHRGDHVFCKPECSYTFPKSKDAPIPWNPPVEVAQYLAGLIDGDGALDIHDRKERVRIGLTDLPVLEWIRSIWPGTCSLEPRKNTKPRHKQMWELELKTNQARSFLLPVFPYLRLKQEIAASLIQQLPVGYGPMSTAYIAGLFDAEGTVMLRRVYDGYVLVTCLSMADEPTILALEAAMPFYSYVNTPKKQREHWQQMHRWEVTAKHAEFILKAMLPYLKIKRERAEIALAFQDFNNHRNGKDPIATALRLRLKELNHRGIS